MKAENLRIGPGRRPRRRLVGAVVVFALVMAGVLAVAAPAWAHGGEENATGYADVQQAIAYIVNKPGNMDAIQDKVNDAIENKDLAGVDVALVKRAQQALNQGGDIMTVRGELAAAIAAAKAASPAVGEQTGTSVVTDPMPGRDNLTRTDIVLFILAGLVAVAGALLSLRQRPADSVRQLRRRAMAAGKGA